MMQNVNKKNKAVMMIHKLCKRFILAFNNSLFVQPDYY